MKRKLNLTFLMTIVMMMLFPLKMAAEESTEPPQQVGYAVFNSAEGTLTFKYGVKPEAGENETVYDLNTETNDPGWYNSASSIKKVIFESSFSNARPTSCYKWFYNCNNVSFTNIEDIKYLNTSEVTNMNSMFNGCSGLTTIYVSDKFTTGSVTNSDNMFKDCTNLVGAIACDGNNIDKTNANYVTGYFKTYYKVNETQTELYGSGNYDTSNNAYNISSLNFTDGDIVTNVPLNVNGGISYTLVN